MPTLQDRRLFEWRAPVRGLVLAASPRDLPPDALSECINFDIDIEAGRLIRRDAWLSTAFLPNEGVTPLAVFEVPATNPPGAPSTPRAVVAVASVGGEPPAYRWLVYMRPHFDGSSWDASSWGRVGGPGVSFTSLSAPTTLSASVVGQDGVYRIYLAYGTSATDPPNQNISLPIWMGFIPTTRRRFMPPTGNYRAADVGPNKFVADDARLLPPPVDLLSLDLVQTSNPSLALGAGARYYRLAYKYDGYQFGALSDVVSLDVPEGAHNFVQCVIHVPKFISIGPRPTHILVFVQTVDRVPDGPGAYGLLETVNLDGGPPSVELATAIESTVENLEPCYHAESVENWNLVPTYNLRSANKVPPGGGELDTPWELERRYFFDVLTHWAVPVHEHFVLSARAGYERLYRSNRFAPDQGVVGFSITSEDGISTNSTTSGILGPGLASDGGTVVTFSNTPEWPSLARYVASRVSRGDVLLNWDYAVGGVIAAAWPWGEVSDVREDADATTITFSPAIPSQGGAPHSLVWLLVSRALVEPSGADELLGYSYIRASSPIFQVDAGADPANEMVITINNEEYVERADNMIATDGVTMLFVSFPSPRYPPGTDTVNGAGVRYGDNSIGWRHNAAYGGKSYYALTAFADTMSDLSQLSTYEELAQDVSLTPWVRASSIARVGRQHFAADLAIPDPSDRLNVAKDTIERYRVVGGNVTGEGQVAPDFFPPTGVSSAGEGTSPIQWTGEWFGRLAILTDESLYLAVPTQGGFLQPERRVRGYGCIGPRTAVLTPEGLVWLGRQGVVRFSGGSVDLMSAPLGSKVFLDSVEANGRTAMGAWDARRARYLLYLVVDTDPYLFALSRSGAWTRYALPFSLVALCQDSSSSGIPSGIALLDDDTYGLVQPDPDATQDLDSVPVTAIATFPEVEPAGGDYLAYVGDAALDFLGSVQLLISVDGRVRATKSFTTTLQGHARLPVGARGRVVGAQVVVTGRGSFVDRVALWAVPKGRARS